MLLTKRFSAGLLSSRRLAGDELTELATLALAISRAFVRTFANARLCEVKVVNLGAAAAEKPGGPVRRYEAEIVAGNFKAAVERPTRFLARKN
jgi:hypothetical protein